MSMIGKLLMVSEAELEGVMRDPATIESLLFRDEEVANENGERELDIDKAWHVLHFLLTGSAWEGDAPLNFLVSGGTEIGEDLGYGPARWFSSADVALIAEALDPLSIDGLRDRIDPDTMARAKIYPHGWDQVGDEDVSGYFLGYFEDLKRFLQRAAHEGTAVIVYLS